jgi:hypothetical protein
MRRILDDTHPRASRRACALFALVACLSGGAVYALVALTGASPSSAALVRATPTASEFGRDFVRTANAYAAAHASARRLTHPDCVEAAPGRYMCSYAITKPGRPVDCHLMQARWQPEGPSTILVTLAGRASRCESLRAALDSLGP